MATDISPDSSPAVITTAPSSSSPSSSQLIDVLPAVIDKREVILFAGVCHRAGAQEQMFCNFFLGAMLAPALCAIGSVCTPLCIPLGVYCSKMAAEAWRLYLTKSAIHYLDIGICNFDNMMWHIPLKYVKAISAQEDSHTLVVKMKPENVYCYVPRPMFKEYDCVILRHCQNAGDFARAVNRQMADSEIE